MAGCRATRGSDATSYEWAGVDAGGYTITVRARNAGGWSLPATATVQVTDLAPQPPDRPAISASGGVNQASASWSADDNGSPILEWYVDGGGMPGLPGRTATGYQWTGVDAGTYTITVSARNAGGEGPPATVTVQVTDPAPQPPDKPTITAEGGVNRASADWSAGDNGSPILEWEVDDGGMPGDPGSDAIRYEWTDVEAGTYTITVRARNAGGWSPSASEEVRGHGADSDRVEPTVGLNKWGTCEGSCSPPSPRSARAATRQDALSAVEAGAFVILVLGDSSTSEPNSGCGICVGG